MQFRAGVLPRAGAIIRLRQEVLPKGRLPIIPGALPSKGAALLTTVPAVAAVPIHVLAARAVAVAPTAGQALRAEAAAIAAVRQAAAALPTAAAALPAAAAHPTAAAALPAAVAVVPALPAAAVQAVAHPDQVVPDARL